MSTTQDILHVNLLDKYRSNGSEEELRSKFKEFSTKHNLIDRHDKFKVGDVIDFFGGFYNNIRYTSEILGFDDEGGIYVLWDCYWFAIKDSDPRKIENHE